MSCVRSSPLRPKKLLILSVNGVLCDFPPLAILQGNVRVFGRNVDKSKVEVKAEVEDVLGKALTHLINLGLYKSPKMQKQNLQCYFF